jgi:hypothetical protein
LADAPAAKKPQRALNVPIAAILPFITPTPPARLAIPVNRDGCHSDQSATI